MRGLTVRARVLASLVGLAAIAIALTGVVAYAAQRAELDSSIEEDLRLRTESFLDLAASDDPATAAPWADVEQLLRSGIAAVVASQTASAVSHVDGVARFVPGGDDRLDLASDDEFLDLATATAQTVVGVQSARTSVTDYRYVSIPVLAEDRTVIATFTIAVDRAALIDELNESFQAYAVAGIAALALMSVVAWFIVGRLLTPVRLLDQTARDITETDLDQRIPIVGNDDLARLSETVNSMLDRIQRAFGAQRQLLDDAGHELRTPLAVMRTKLELLEPRDPADVERAQELLLDEVAMMSRLVDDLVVLAKADRPEFVQKDSVDVTALVDSVVERAAALGRRDWSVGDRAESVFVDGDQQRLEQALMQLCANAVKFSEPDTPVTVGSRAAGGEILLWVADHGVGIAPEDVPHVTERFGRVDESVEGAGLGLPIVAALAAAHGGRLHIDSTLGVGSRFTIALPLPPREGESR